MGLDIAYYKNLTRIDCVFDEDGEPIDPTTRQPIETYFKAYVNPAFPGRNGIVAHKGVYSYESRGSFCAGNYSAYNTWREELAKLAGFPAKKYERFGAQHTRHDAGAFAAEAGPFWELICFSDCEGVIGSEVSAKIAADFASFQAAADDHGDEWFRRQYADWRTAFETAAQNGAVYFA